MPIAQSRACHSLPCTGCQRDGAEVVVARSFADGGGERRQAEVTVIGREGMSGIPIVLGTERAPCDVFMQVEGSGQSIGANELADGMDQSDTMTRCFLR
jgi:hypothetical protein